MSENPELIPVRLSHLLRHCSVGAIVRGPDYLMTVKDIRYWTDKHGEPAGESIRYVDRVRSALGIEQELRQPPIAREMENDQVEGVCVPAMRFPCWMRCPNPNCGLLHYKPWHGLKSGEKPRCQQGGPKCPKRPELEQVPWILIHQDGRMRDVPWHFLAHFESGGRGSQAQKQCRRDWQAPYLRLISLSNSKRQLRCERCASVRGFNDSDRITYGKDWPQPWIKESVSQSDDEGNIPAEIVEINDARVHFPVTKTALVIPPESRIRKGTVLDRLYCNAQKLQQIHNARTPLARKAALLQIASELRSSVADVEAALREIDKGYPGYGKNFTQGLLLEGEYRAFLDELPEMADDEDFVTHHHTDAWKRLIESHPATTNPGKIIAAINRVIAVDRLKEIVVLTGFKRLSQDGKEVPPDLVGESAPSANGVKAWWPALELYGEGIFLSLDEGMLARWEAHPIVKQHAVAAQKRFAGTKMQFQPEIKLTPRFLLLHTLSHLLIRQLETHAGYSAASLKERIYCTAGELAMSGILIYVAVPDVGGSLGGLVELATPKRFLALLSSVFEHAQWCSFDPVCSHHEGQGPSLLNRAACHGCALIPEPSCAYGNVLLDRTFIIGDAAAQMPSFLDFALGSTA